MKNPYKPAKLPKIIKVPKQSVKSLGKVNNPYSLDTTGRHQCRSIQ